MAAKGSSIRTVNIHEAKTHLSRLVDEAAEGRAFVIAKAGKPMAKVVPLDSSPETTLKRRVGFMRGMFTIPDNYEEIDERLDREIEQLFYGEE